MLFGNNTLSLKYIAIVMIIDACTVAMSAKFALFYNIKAL